MASHSLSQMGIGMGRMSESVFVGMCNIVGTSQQVAFRRDVEDLVNLVKKQSETYYQLCEKISGSYREGFRLQGSDRDHMFWLPDHTVIWYLPQALHYDFNTQTLILSDSSESPPGYTLLELLTPTNKKNVKSACFIMKDKHYISSSAYRRLTLILPNSVEHGPCGSGYIDDIQYDTAYGFVCDFWPPSASSWIDRCHSWPPTHIMNDIVRSGCHVVAIGHQMGNYEDKEWRISFSLAEQKLVFCMNHSQFLTYGLLKIFLKEVINNGLSEDEKLLSSYHVKTAVFWMLQQNTIRNWCPQNLLEGFWICLKFIVKCVYEGNCPNFFISENNLFLSKIYGEAQNNLFIRLHGFYEKGLACLLHSPSICSYIIQFLRNPTQAHVIPTDEQSRFLEYDAMPIGELDEYEFPHIPDQYHCIQFIKKLEQFLSSGTCLSQYQVIMLRKLTTTILHKTVFILYNQFENIPGNRFKYKTDKISKYMLKLVAKFGYVSEMLYTSMYYYRTYRFKKAIYVLEKAKVKLNEFCQIYGDMLETEDAESQVVNVKERLAVTGEIEFDRRICYITELFPEQQCGLRDRDFPIDISINIQTFILLHMLEFLCFTQVDPAKAQTALNDLRVVVHLDQIVPPSVGDGDISLQVLGICQQISGNHYAAISSFLQSIGQDPLSKIQIATLVRIRDSLRVIRPDLFR